MSLTTNHRAPQILYIDDDPDNRTLVNRLLSSYQFEVLEADTGLAGLQLAQRTLPDLILMDIGMPGLDGHETTTRMRSIAGLQDTPIVAITADITQGAREMALAAGCDGYIPKPIDVDEFPNQVIAFLEGHRETISGDERQYYLGQYSQRLVERLEAKVVELENANRRLQKIDKMKTDFITIAAHELRTPITLVYGYARLLQTEVQKKISGGKTVADVSQLAHRISHSVHRLSEVVNDILNISLIETDQMVLDQSSVNLAELFKVAINELSLDKNERNLTITLENLEDLPPISGDPERLRQVFWNILSNAIKFTPDGGSILVKGWEAAATETASQPGFKPSRYEAQQKSLIIMVQDTGIGIDPSEQSEIFDRFYIVEDTAYHSTSKTAFKGGGMGLGLPIAKGIIEAHGGRIWVESQGRNVEDPTGSTFYVLLPINQPPQKD